MADLLVRGTSARAGEPAVRVTPESAGWEHVGFEVHALVAGGRLSLPGAGREQCLVVLAGSVDVTVGHVRFGTVGERPSVFAGPPAAVYAPPGQDLEVSAHAVAEVALCWSPASGDRVLAPYEVRPEDVTVEIRGSGAMERRIHPIVMEDRPAAALLVVEVLTPAGHWSSYPPHRHDRSAEPHETALEETYYHRIEPASGFGLQRVYSDERDLDESIAFGDGDVVLVPRGYHTVSAPPGYDLYYLNVMAGPRRRWAIHNDPAHEWLLR